MTRRAETSVVVPASRRAFLGAMTAAASNLLLPSAASGMAARRQPDLRRLPDPVQRGILVWDTSPLGYMAEEYILSGEADIFEPTSMADAPDMSQRDNLADFLRRDFRLHVVRSAQPYATRLTVYRPADPAAFSGTVFFEVLHPSGGGSALVWSRTYRSMIKRGDAYVGIQPPLTVAGLKQVDPARYGALEAAHATQLWDAVADAAALGRKRGQDGLFSDLRVERQILVGYSYTGAATAGFKSYHHERVAQRDGQRAFDGYVPMAAAIYTRPGDVPVMRLTTQSDFGGRGGIQNRLPDSDERSAPFRLYEVAGASHKTMEPVGWGLTAPAASVPPPAGLPNYPAETCVARFPAGSIPNDFPLYYVMSGALANVARWIATGAAPPRAARLTENADGTARLDADGNAIGGVRLPQLSVPAATYGVGADRCELFGFTRPFAPDRMRQRYRTAARYRDAVSSAAGRLVDERWIEPDYRQALIEQCTAIAHF